MVVLFVAIIICATIVPRRNTGHDLHSLTNIPCAINVRYWHGADRKSGHKVRCERGAEVGNPTSNGDFKHSRVSINAE